MNSTDPDYDDPDVDSHGIYAELEEDTYDPYQDERYGSHSDNAEKG